MSWLIWGLPKIGVPFSGGPHNKDYCNLGSILGSPYFGKPALILKHRYYTFWGPGLTNQEPRLACIMLPDTRHIPTWNPECLLPVNLKVVWQILTSPHVIPSSRYDATEHDLEMFILRSGTIFNSLLPFCFSP